MSGIGTPSGRRGLSARQPVDDRHRRAAQVEETQQRRARARHGQGHGERGDAGRDCDEEHAAAAPAANEAGEHSAERGVEPPECPGAPRGRGARAPGRSLQLLLQALECPMSPRLDRSAARSRARRRSPPPRARGSSGRRARPGRRRVAARRRSGAAPAARSPAQPPRDPQRVPRDRRHAAPARCAGPGCGVDFEPHSRRSTATRGERADPLRNRPSARCALTNASWAASSASAASPAITNAVRKASDW